ncbi:MAG: hypothetical protein PVF87_11225, partial [Acidimicrobiia bacterium]
MTARTESTGRVARSATALIVTVASVGLALAASAASLGGVGVGVLFTQETDVSIDIPDSPDPIVSTDFSGCSNFIDGWTDESGNTWTSRSGN